MVADKNKNNTTENKEENKTGKITNWKEKITDLIEFLTYGIWRIDYKSLSKKTSVFYNIIKTIILTVRNTLELELGVKAASLTYRTVLAIIPFLAVLFAIARGFGFENIIQSEILDYLGMTPIGNVPQGESNLMIEIITLINNSLEYAKGSGVFAGVGVVLLLYTVFTLFRDIENNFNRIWQIKKGRSMHRRAVDYSH
jgi:membrane protein